MNADRLIGLAYACERFHTGQWSRAYRVLCAIDWKPGTDQAARLLPRDEWADARAWAAHYMRYFRRENDRALADRETFRVLIGKTGE